MHRRGVTDSPGLYFLGLSWQHTRGSALLGWVKDDAGVHRATDRCVASGSPPTQTPEPVAEGHAHANSRRQDEHHLRSLPDRRRGPSRGTLRPSWSSWPTATASTCASRRWPSDLGDATVRMLAYNGSIPGPDPEGARRARRSSSTSRTRATWRPRSTGTGYGSRTATTERTRRSADGGRRAVLRRVSPSLIPGSTGTTRTSARTTARSMGLYGNVLVEPADPDYWPPVHRELRADARRHPARGRQGGALQPHRDDPRGDGPLRRRAAGERRARSLAERSARRGRPPLPDEHRQHPRVQGRAARCADEARRRRQRPRRARAVRRRRGARSLRASGGRRAVRPGRRSDAGAPHPGAGLSAGRDQVSEDRAEPSLEEQFEVLRTNADMVAERERIAPYLDAEPDKTLAFIAEMDMGAPEGDGPVVYTCPMHPEVTSEEPGHCPECGMKLLPAAARRGGRRRPRARARRPRRTTTTPRPRGAPTGSSGKTTWSRSTG